jgi:transcriptional/translational regulatory protein YebC/TACO1
MFERKGILMIDPGVTTEETLMEIAIEAGAEDVQPTDDGGFEITTGFTDFATVRDALDAAKIATSSAEIQQIPTTMAELDVAEQKKVLKLLDALEDNDDVQNVYHNLELSEEALED